MLTTVHLKRMVLLRVEPPTIWKLDIMLETVTGQLREEVYLWEIRLFLGSREQYVRRE